MKENTYLYIVYSGFPGDHTQMTPVCVVKWSRYGAVRDFSNSRVEVHVSNISFWEDIYSSGLYMYVAVVWTSLGRVIRPWSWVGTHKCKCVMVG